MDNSIVHILVIWSKGLDHKEEILADLQKDFEVLKVFNGHWDKDKFLQNYMVFYAHSQYHLDPASYKRLLQGKVDHCGDEDFTVVILRDTQPHFEIRHTSSGNRMVNTRMFDKKTQYRALTGGGHKIHSSDDAWETNHDLTLMFGLNTEDFCKEFILDGNETSFSQNCQGVSGYKSIQNLFYVLNNCIRYVVMRNHECIPDQYTVEGHGDIDLLCDNKNWMSYLTAAKPIFQENYRVYHTIMIGGNEVPFDFRFVGDNYYDKPWQENILNSRILLKGLFYAPNPENQFFSLLYHAYIQKREVKEDYLPKLAKYAKSIGINYDSEVKTAVSQLDSFMRQHKYEYTHPHDKSVVFNQNNVAHSDYALRYGSFLKRLVPLPDDPMQFHSCIYEKSNSFIKIGSTSLIENEAKYLERLWDCDRVPKVLRLEQLENADETLLEISRVAGENSEVFFSDSSHHTWSVLRGYVIACVQLLIMLAENKIAHRDFLPTNLMVAARGNSCQVSLIDFGWSIDLGHHNENRPINLGGWFTDSKNSTDSNTFATQLTFYWYDLFYIRIISHLLRNIEDSNASNPQLLLKKYKIILFIAQFFVSIHDIWRLFCRRHSRIGLLKQTIVESLRR